MAILISSAFFSLPSNATTLDAGAIKIEIDASGRIVHLYDTGNKRDYVNPSLPTHLLRLKRYSGNTLQTPQSVAAGDPAENAATLKIKFDAETTLTVVLRSRDGWIDMELKKATGIEDIEAIRWGPFNTNILGPVGGFFGVLHAENATLGLMSLEPNTDGRSMNNKGVVNPRTSASDCAGWLPVKNKGTFLLLDSLDHTRPGKIDFHRMSRPVGKTVLGSKAALYLAEKGRELDLIERIVKAEGLPYLTLDGVWIKKAVGIRSPSVWGGYGEKNALEYMALCKSFGGNVISSFSRMFGNWGHFSIDPKLYSGPEAVRKASLECLRNGIHMNMHTLSNFIKPINVPEPFITPKPDPRLAKYDFAAELAAPIDAGARTISLKSSPGLDDFLGKNAGKDSQASKMLLKLGDELIFHGDIRRENGAVVLSGCKRGYLMSTKGAHKAGTKAGFLFYAGYSCVFAGDMPMFMEVAANLGKRVRQCAIGKVSLDGHESAAYGTGHGLYAMNMLLSTISGLNNDREMIFTGSCITNYCWHALGYISWGEFDTKKGFRGTMLDYRIRRQIQLENSLMPHKLGQHYPNKDTTIEDIDWLLGQAVGWNAGVELSVNLANFNRNPHRDEIVALVADWERIRRSGKVTEQQKLRLRQVDRVFAMEKSGAAWKLVPLQTHWSDPRCEILPSSAIKLENLSGPEKATPPKIGIAMTHNPLVFRQAALSGDIPLFAGRKNAWRVTMPEASPHTCFKVTLRVPPHSPCGIKNIRIAVKGRPPIMVPVEIEPGQHIASPLDAPVFFLYDGDNRVIKQIQPLFADSLPGLGKDPSFEFECEFDSLDSAKTPTAIINTLFSKCME